MTDTALITGASRGLGLALARGLAADGWALIIDGRDPTALAHAAGELTGTTTVVAVAGDITDPAHRMALAAAAADHGGLDLLVNNAGTLGPSPLPALRQLPTEELRRLHATNVEAPLGIIQGVLPLLRPGAAIVNITSDAAVEAYPGWGGYGATKAALEQLARVLAVEEPQLQVWAFDPGDMRTAMHQAAFPGEDISDRPLPEDVAVPALRRLLAERPPSGRVRAVDVLQGVRS